MNKHVNEADALTRLAGQLTSYDRVAFIEQLAVELSSNKPSDAKRKAFNEKHPDRWLQGVAILARLAGFTDRTESLNVSIIADLNALSDVELESRLISLTGELARIKQASDITAPSEPIDITPVDIAHDDITSPVTKADDIT